MALVMLPSDLPWWKSVQRYLKHLLLASSPTKLVATMLKIHDMCNIGIDPEEDVQYPDLMEGFERFLTEELEAEECRHFLDNTIKIMVNRALHLPRWRPPKGLMFSLQQQSDATELDYNFVSSLIAHAFFSTLPKRTLKTHPTLQDFNFTHFFKNLQSKSQMNKLKSLIHYFEWLDKTNNEGSIKISRQVMTSKQWLTIEDWLECTLPLCKLQVRHEGRPERCEAEDALRICFASSRVGGDALIDGESQESLSMFMMPELLPVLLSVEALEDNEVLKVENVRLISRIPDKKNKSNVEFLEEPKLVTVCLMDAEDYSALPFSQWEEDNVLRELNKCLLAFQQTPMQSRDSQRHERRLSPIGESLSHTPPEVESSVVIKQPSSCSTLNSYNSRSPSPQPRDRRDCANTLNLNDPSVEILKHKCWLSAEGATLNNRRGRFIVLGSSGECLPVTRGPACGRDRYDSLYSSCSSSDEEFHSANDSFDYGKYDSEDEGRGESARPNSFQYSKELSTEERRLSFAGRLQEALRREAQPSCTTSTGDWSSDSSSYVGGISISGAELNDNCSTLNSYNSPSPQPRDRRDCANTLNLNDPSVEIQKHECWLSAEGATLNNRRGRFIVLGSSGECLPVTRGPACGRDRDDSLYSSCSSSDEEFHSANDSFDYGKYGSEDEGRGESARPNSFQYSKELSTEERRLRFAGRVREALQREAQPSCTASTGDWSSDSSSYAVGISISGAELNDNDIRVKRESSMGFVLTEKEIMSNDNPSPRHGAGERKETGNSSKYSFSTEYTSELEEVYEQFSQWLNDPIIDKEGGEHKREMDPRDLAVIRFAGSLLKRTLSESLAGGAGAGAAGQAEVAELYPRDARDRAAPRRLALAARSLSLELARHRHRLAAQLKLKVKECIPELPEKIIQHVLQAKCSDDDSEADKQNLASMCDSTDSLPMPQLNQNVRKKKFNWVINMIVETIEENIECEPVTIKLKKPKLSQLAHRIVSGGPCRPVATGNWGCGRRLRGHPQLKLLLQWLAASVAGVPVLIYYTYGNEKLFKCDTLVRVLVDRKWSVGQLARAVLHYARSVLRDPRPHTFDDHSLFDDLIGIDRTPDHL